MKTKNIRDSAYAKAGVNLSAGDMFSSIAGKVVKESFNNSPYVIVRDMSRGHFRGPRGWNYVGLPDDCFEVAAPDGIGTATIILSAAETDESASSRLLAMTAGDITRHGGLPLVFLNILEVKRLGEPGLKIFNYYEKMMRGLGQYAKKYGYVLSGGETAEMGVCVSSEMDVMQKGTGHPAYKYPMFNWSGVMLGVNHPDKVIDGLGLRPGMTIVALQDDLRSNGASMIRAFLRHKYGLDWWKNAKAKKTIRAIASPAKQYDRFLASMNGWYSPDFKPKVKMPAIAHLSGGGIKSKFADDILFPLGLSAELTDLYQPPGFMADCVNSKAMEMSDEDGYTVFNGGQGALVVLDESDVNEFTAEALKMGIKAKRAGGITKRYRDPRLIVHSKYSGRKIRFRPGR